MVVFLHLIILDIGHATLSILDSKTSSFLDIRLEITIVTLVEYPKEAFASVSNLESKPKHAT